MLKALCFTQSALDKCGSELRTDVHPWGRAQKWPVLAEARRLGAFPHASQEAARATPPSRPPPPPPSDYQQQLWGEGGNGASPHPQFAGTGLRGARPGQHVRGALFPPLFPSQAPDQCSLEPHMAFLCAGNWGVRMKTPCHAGLARSPPTPEPASCRGAPFPPSPLVPSTAKNKVRQP